MVQSPWLMASKLLWWTYPGRRGCGLVLFVYFNVNHIFLIYFLFLYICLCLMILGWVFLCAVQFNYRWASIGGMHHFPQGGKQCVGCLRVWSYRERDLFEEVWCIYCHSMHVTHSLSIYNHSL